MTTGDKKNMSLDQIQRPSLKASGPRKFRRMCIHGPFCGNTRTKQNHRLWQINNNSIPQSRPPSVRALHWSTCPSEKWGMLHRRQKGIDCSLASRIYQYSINHFSSCARFRYATKARIDGHLRSVTKQARQYVSRR